MGYGNCGGERTIKANGKEAHCCHLGHGSEVCPLLVDYGGTIACSLMLLHDGSWDDVEADPRYQAWIQPRLSEMTGNVSCRTWPETDPCQECGATGGSAIGGTPVPMPQNEKRAMERDVVTPQLEQWAADHPDEGP